MSLKELSSLEERQAFSAELAELVAIQRSRGYKKGWVYYKLRDRWLLTFPALAVISQTLGYQYHWKFFQWEDLCYYYNEHHGYTWSHKLESWIPKSPIEYLQAKHAEIGEVDRVKLGEQFERCLSSN